MPLRLPHILLALLCLSYSGCSIQQFNAPQSKRKESLVPYRDAKIQGEAAPQFLARRSAILIRTDKLKVTGSSKNFVTFQFDGKDPSRYEFDLGTAAAIDSRGYFLTAGHCVDNGIPYLSFLTDQKMQATPARVVWRGRPKGGPDLALLHIPFSLKYVFAWSSEIQPGEKIFIVGSGLAKFPNIQLQAAAGKILPFPRPVKTRPPALNFNHDAPLHQGDSGGPVVTHDGRLAGIDVGIQYKYYLWKLSGKQTCGDALRPDPGWIKTLIEQDQMKLSKKIPSSH